MVSQGGCANYFRSLFVSKYRKAFILIHLRLFLMAILEGKLNDTPHMQWACLCDREEFKTTLFTLLCNLNLFFNCSRMFLQEHITLCVLDAQFYKSVAKSVFQAIKIHK